MQEKELQQVRRDARECSNRGGKEAGVKAGQAASYPQIIERLLRYISADFADDTDYKTKSILISVLKSASSAKSADTLCLPDHLGIPLIQSPISFTASSSTTVEAM